MPTDTLGSMKASVIRWLRGEQVDDADITDAINDAVETLWMALVISAMNILMGGPVNVTFNSGDERETIVSITDPTQAPTAVDLVGQSTLAQTTFQVGYTYVTESGSETNISPLLVYLRGANNLAQVSVPITLVSGAIGWNLYVGTATANLAKQNPEPIPILTNIGPAASQSFTEPATGFTPYPDGGDLPPTSNTTGDNIFMIKHLEFKTTDNIYKNYNAGDLDSLYMRRFSSIIATPSQYQSYAWDLINQNQIEIRPAAGQTFTPRFFYIVKPRRRIFDNSPLPFPTVPQVKFIRCAALSDLFDSLHEYAAAERWEGKAAKELIAAQRAISQLSTNRNDLVTPYMYGGGW